MLEVNLVGSYYEMGQKHGHRLRKTSFKVPQYSNAAIELGKKCRRHVEIAFPEIIDEIQGISDVAEIEFDSLCSFLLTHPHATPKCSIFAVTDGRTTYIGRNYDMFYSLKDTTESYFTAPKGGFKNVGQTDIFVGREDGVNEKGLGVAMSGITDYFEPGVPFWIAIRYLLDRCKTVQEGVDFLTEISHHCTISFLLADSTGEMAVIEAKPGTAVIREPQDDYIVSTNHYNHPVMKRLKIFEPPDSQIRYSTIVDSLGDLNAGLDEDTIRKILSSHEGLVCSHIDEMKLGTLWSIVANLNTLQVWRSDGHPCSNPYEEDTRLCSGTKQS